MNQNKLSFESENLVVDYISFNIQGLIDPKLIANYFFQNFGFNYTIEKRLNGKWKSESSNSARQNQFNVSTQKQANIKKLIVESFHQLQHHNRIKNKFQLVTKSGKVQETNKLVPLKIGQSKTIRFYEVF